MQTIEDRKWTEYDRSKKNGASQRDNPGHWNGGGVLCQNLLRPTVPAIPLMLSTGARRMGVGPFVEIQALRKDCE
jgi:hypothetical protein